MPCAAAERAHSWAVRYRIGGRPRKHTLGSYPAVDLKTARNLASKALRAAAEGRMLARKGQRARHRLDTVEAIGDLFIERHCKRANRPRTVEGTERLLRQYVLPRWKGRLAREITRRDVIDLLDRVVNSGKPTTANRVLAAVRKMFNWAVARDILHATPCVGVEPPADERSRDRVLTDGELRNVSMAAPKIGGPYGALVKLLILTGQRRNEVARLPWSEIDLQARVWALPPERTRTTGRARFRSVPPPSLSSRRCRA